MVPVNLSHKTKAKIPPGRNNHDKRQIPEPHEYFPRDGLFHFY